MVNIEQYLRELPAVDSLLREPPLEALRGSLPRKIILAAAQETVERHRQRIGQHCSGEPIDREAFPPQHWPAAARKHGQASLAGDQRHRHRSPYHREGPICGCVQALARTSATATSNLT